MAWSDELTTFVFNALCAAIQSYYCCAGIRGIKTETSFSLILCNLFIIAIPLISINAILVYPQ